MSGDRPTSDPDLDSDEFEFGTLPEDEPVLEAGEAPGFSFDTGASFCPECGQENAAGSENCTKCGRNLNAFLEPPPADDPRRKLHGVVVATVTGICLVAVVGAWLTGLSMQLGVREVLHFEGDRPVTFQVLSSSAGLMQVFGLAFAFGFAGLLAALVFGGRYLREVVLGATGGLFVQFLLWLFMVRAAGGTLRADLWIVGEGFVMRGPAPILLPQLLLLFLFTTMAFAFAGWVAREQLTGFAVCIHCHSPYRLVPKPPLRCPKCDAEQARDGVQWPWVMAVSLITALVFAGFLVVSHESLGFALECQGKMSEACKGARGDDAYTIFVTAISDDTFVFWAVDMWRFIGLSAPLMLLAPLALTFVVKRGSRASAGALIPINWLLATFVVMIVLSDLGSSEAGFIFLLRMQVLALFVWGAVGIVAVFIGDKLRYRSGSAYLDELDD